MGVGGLRVCCLGVRVLRFGFPSPALAWTLTPCGYAAYDVVFRVCGFGFGVFALGICRN